LAKQFIRFAPPIGLTKDASMKKILFALGAVSLLFGWLIALKLVAIALVGMWVFSKN
jgi:hypothetical protein